MVIQTAGCMRISTYADFQIELKKLIDEYRNQCLWFLDEHFYPTEKSRQLRTLAYIEHYGDRRAFQKARQLKEWLLQNSKEISSNS